jgi:hypothetical protein
VRKEEKVIFILAPTVRTKESTEAEDKGGNRVLLGFRGCGVFDYSQTEGCELPSIGRVAGDPNEYHERLTKFVAAQGVALSYDQAICSVCGISEGGKITLLPRMPPAENFATLVHELAHEILHRANRATTTKRQRETEAEAVAFVVCHAIGLETGTASQDYIQLYNGDAKLLLDRLERVRSAASQILDGIVG